MQPREMKANVHAQRRDNPSLLFVTHSMDRFTWVPDPYQSVISIICQNSQQSIIICDQEPNTRSFWVLPGNLPEGMSIRESGSLSSLLQPRTPADLHVR